ncbi:AsmA family protein [Prosthecomicrobium sp. N25]|uniref:AsmA family protein n=1 Tax=Prosthecomicrobium sp. N25 TaxID=3129254 RepID=UPI00307698B3
MKRLLFGLAFAGGFAASLAATKHLVPADVVRSELARTLSGLAGTSVALSGDADVSVFPVLKVRFRDLAVDRADGGGRLASMRELAARLDVLPLLIGRVSVSEIALTAPSLRLDRALSLDGLAPAKAGLAALEPLRLTVEDGTLEIADPETGRRESLEGVNASFMWPRLASGASLETTFRWRGEPVAVALQGIGPRALAEGTPGSATFTLTSAPLRVAFDGKGLLLDRLQLDGVLRVSAADLGRAAAWLGRPAGSPGAFRDFSLDGRMRSLGLAATVSDARFGLDGNSGDGVLSVRLDAPRPQLRGTLAFESFDVGPYMAAFAGGRWRGLGLDQERLSGVDLDLRLSTSLLRAGGQEADKVAATLLAKDGRFDAEVGEASAFGGSLRLVLRGEAKPEGLRVAGRLTGADLMAGRLAAALGLPAIEDGRLAVSTEGEALGATLGGLVDAFSGRFHAEARHVVLRSADAAAVGGARVQTIAFSTPRTGRPQVFDKAVADAIVLDRVAHVHRLEADSAALSARLTGEASLATGSLSLSGQMTMPEQAGDIRSGPPRRAVPVRIGGTLAKPVTVSTGSGAQPAIPNEWPGR